MIRVSDGSVLAGRTIFASDPATRIRGLLGRTLGHDEALVIEPASQIHTFGMRYRIDVVFCDRDLEVLHISRSVRPWRITRWVRGARYAIELNGGTVPDRLGPGDRLEIS